MNPAFRKIHDVICAWLRANGIEPNTVPISEVPTIADGRITCRVHTGQHTGLGDPACRTIVVPLVEQPPAVLAHWLAGKVRP